MLSPGTTHAYRSTVNPTTDPPHPIPSHHPTTPHRMIPIPPTTPAPPNPTPPTARYYSIFTLFMLVMFECTVVGQRMRTLKELRSLQVPKQKLHAYRCGPPEGGTGVRGCGCESKPGFCWLRCGGRGCSSVRCCATTSVGVGRSSASSPACYRVAEARLQEVGRGDGGASTAVEGTGERRFNRGPAPQWGSAASKLRDSTPPAGRKSRAAVALD